MPYNVLNLDIYITMGRVPQKGRNFHTYTFDGCLHSEEIFSSRDSSVVPAVCVAVEVAASD